MGRTMADLPQDLFTPAEQAAVWGDGGRERTEFGTAERGAEHGSAAFSERSRRRCRLCFTALVGCFLEFFLVFGGRATVPETETTSQSKDSVIQNLLVSLTNEIRGKFEVSEHNQEKIGESCVALETKLNMLTERISRIETVVAEQETRVSANFQGIAQFVRKEKVFQEKLESLENNLQRNNIRLLMFLKMWRARTSGAT
ncbi:hypothetical protein NDU88_004336 [Pleurodeles waltl]|uniref:Uncharacterized protein n=1 Tax=Pleurodeles waltl TaxID=8319 RepID=A0AAV7SIJ2_PLEWA|nr:hypothetical protein NDU88_004336 [Pleurodeles waltl]